MRAHTAIVMTVGHPLCTVPTATMFTGLPLFLPTTAWCCKTGAGKEAHSGVWHPWKAMQLHPSYASRLAACRCRTLSSSATSGW
jgi:hypothetical protein